MTELLLKVNSSINAAQLIREYGKILSIKGLLIEASGCDVHIGELVDIRTPSNTKKIQAEVVGMNSSSFQLLALGSIGNLCLGSRIAPTGKTFHVPVGNCLLGRIINASGDPLDDRGPLPQVLMVNHSMEPIHPLNRAKIDKPIVTGVRAIDAFTPIGYGQRIGIFAGSGVGKSTLLSMLSRCAQADVIVVALIGERGREVGDFLRESQQHGVASRTVVVVASAEQPAVMRKQAAYTATAIAEWFREQNRNVLLIVDSITRFALAQREIGLATGEPMGPRGFPPSAFSLLPPLLERAGGLHGKGSITAVYTVLVEGDDMNDPVADNMRAILDGHIVLSRDLVSQNHYPAIDVLQSVSRLTTSIQTKAQRLLVDRVRTVYATYRSSEELIKLGVYEHGSDSKLDESIRLKPSIDSFLQQRPDEHENADNLWRLISSIASGDEDANEHKQFEV